MANTIYFCKVHYILFTVTNNFLFPNNRKIGKIQMKSKIKYISNYYQKIKTKVFHRNF